MIIAGFQKSTFLDYPGKISALIFTYGCNLRCGYCHNPELVVLPCSRSTLVKEEEVLTFLEKRKDFLDALVITGGEPTLQKDLIQFIQRVKDIGLLVKLDTNGTDPKIVEKILDMNIVDYWAMDIKYEEEIYMQNLQNEIQYKNIRRSIQLLMEKAEDYEFRTTYVKGIHKIESAEGIGKIIQGSKRYYIQNFRPGKTIEMGLNSSNSFSSTELKKIQRIMRRYVENVEIRE